MPQSWYALCVKSNRERLVSETAKEKGYEEFLPIYRSRRRWSDRYKDIDLPLFPGYVFCRFDIANRLPLLSIPGVAYIVGVGKTPVPLADQEIAAIRAVTQSGLSLQPWPFVDIGQAVLIEDGPLRGVVGVVINTKGAQHLIVSITLLQRSVAVDVDRRWARHSDPQPTWNSTASLKKDPERLSMGRPF